MKIELHASFKKSYKKRVFGNRKLEQRAKERVRLFQKDRRSLILKDHQLEGKMCKLRAFSVSGDTRIVYYRVSKEKVLFIDIGSHNQVY